MTDDPQQQPRQADRETESGRISRSGTSAGISVGNESTSGGSDPIEPGRHSDAGKTDPRPPR